MNTTKIDKFKIHVMPTAVHDNFVENDKINENEFYIIDDGNDVVPLEQGGTGVRATDVAQLRTVLGVAAVDHTSTEKTCGVGDNKTFGHVKLSDETDSEEDATSGVAATPAAVAAKADKSVTIKVTLEASQWIDNEYTILNTNIKKTSNGFFGIDESLSDEEYDAAIEEASNAEIRQISQDDGMLVLRCRTVPTTDIPISILCMY